MQNSKSQAVSVLLKLFFLILVYVPALAQETVLNHSALSAPVEVLIPETQIPTINAETELDAAFVVGYMHAKDRFFQMDYTRHLAQGKISEMVGSVGIGTDIRLRTMGFVRAAERSMSVLSAETQGILKSYADGVNAWLDTQSLPPEYTALEIDQANRWLPVHSVAIAKLISFELSNDLQEIDWTIAIGTFQQVGAAAGFDGTALFMEDLYRSAPPDDRVSIPGFLDSIGGIGKAADLNVNSSKSRPMIDLNISDVQMTLLKSIQSEWNSNPILKALKNDGTVDKGSNFWMIAGNRTENGYPLIANDPHLSLDYPSTFYPFHVNVEGVLNVAGVGFPGAPIVAQGCNDDLCWGSTVHPVDETDFFFEDIVTNMFGLPTHTVYQGEHEPVVWIFQSYFANVVGDGIMNNLERQNVGYTEGALTLIIPRRNNGPVLSIDLAAGKAVSMQYTGNNATREIESFFEMAKSSSIAEFKQALTKFDVGSQNFAVSDVAGNIAYFTGAEVPIREDLQTLMAPDGAPPMFVRDGSGVRMNEWMPISNPQANQAEKHEIIPIDEMPNVTNPASGYIANANNDPIGVSADNNVLNQVRPGGGLYYISQGGYSTYRMGRLDRLIQDALASNAPINTAMMKSFQANNQLMDAELITPHVLRAFQNAAASDAWSGIAQFLLDPRMAQALSYLEDWDFSTPTGIAEGYDPFENPFALSPPTDDEINNSVAASIYSVWRSMAIQNTIDATIQGVDVAIGSDVLVPQLPGSKYAFNAFKNLLDTFEESQGYGASGLNFFTNPSAPTRNDARDFLILASLLQALDNLAGDDFADAFNNSTDLSDYRWGKLHRIVFSHPLSASLSVPNGLFGLSTVDGLAGVARSGGYQVLDASSHDIRANGSNEFMFNAGPARRVVAEITEFGIIAEQIIPGGQSGNITTGALYVNQLFLWLVNAYLPLITDFATIDAIAVQRLVFEP